MGKQLYTEEREEFQELTLEEGEEKDERLTLCQVILLNISWFGLSLMMIVLSVEVIPPQIQAMVGESSKGRWLGGIVATGAVVTFVSGPLVGMQSDRLVSKHGKRRPIMIAATLILCMSLFGMAFSAPQITIAQSVDHPELCTDKSSELLAHRCRHHQNTSLSLKWILPKSGSTPVGIPSKKNKFIYDNQAETIGNVWLFALFYMFMTISGTAVLVTYSALLADKAHPKQRGLTSGVMGFMVLSGQVAGAMLGIGIVQMGVLLVYSCVVILLVVCIVITVLTIVEPPSSPPVCPLNFLQIISNFWKPIKEVNFRWVFITKFLMQQGLYTVMAFLEYWMADMMVIPFCWSPQRAVAVFLFPVMSTAAVTSIVCGILSDKVGRRKIFVIISCISMSIVALVYACIEGDHAYTIAIAMAFLFGAGFGCFQAVDFALLMDVLPEEKDKANDIAVWSQATVLAQALATPLGGIIVDLFEGIMCEIGLGYIILFLVTMVYFLFSGIFVLKITGQMGVLLVYSCVVILLVVCIVITVLTIVEPPSSPPVCPLNFLQIISNFWKPIKEVNFRWVFITKFLMQQGLYTVMAFLEYWMADMMVIPFCWSPQRAVAVFLFPVMSTAAVTSIVCGILSDKVGRRKIFVIISCISMSIVALVYACIEGDHAYTIAIAMAFLFGAGFGCFQAVDFALLMDVLPEEKDKANDIAVWSQATVLAQALATPLGGIIVDLFEGIMCEIGLGYIILFLVTMVYFLFSGIFVLKITGVP